MTFDHPRRLREVIVITTRTQQECIDLRKACHRFNLLPLLWRIVAILVFIFHLYYLHNRTVISSMLFSRSSSDATWFIINFNWKTVSFRLVSIFFFLHFFVFLYFLFVSFFFFFLILLLWCAGNYLSIRFISVHVHIKFVENFRLSLRVTEPRCFRWPGDCSFNRTAPGPSAKSDRECQVSSYVTKESQSFIPDESLNVNKR